MLLSRTRSRLTAGVVAIATAVAVAVLAHPGSATAATQIANTISSTKLAAGFASDGSIQSLKIPGDTYDTQYVMNPDTAPEQAAETNAKYKQWLGNVMFSYATGNGTISKTGVGTTPWKKAWTTESADGRTVSVNGNTVTVTYKNSTDAEGVKGFTFTQTYTVAADGSITWKQNVENTSGQRLVLGDWGLPIPANELWKGGDSIYETRVLTHSYVGKNGSYLTLQRPSGQGPGIMITADTGTGSGFEYQDRWRTQEVGDTSWAWNSDNESSNIKGLNVYYPNSTAIQSTNRGYLGSTATTLAAGASKTLTFHISKFTSDNDRQDVLYNQGLLDTTVVPGLVVPYDQTAQAAFRIKGTITSVTAKNNNDLGGANPTNPKVTFSRANGDYRIYSIAFDKTQLGTNLVTVNYTDAAGRSRSSVLQFSVTDKVANALNAHADFMVKNQQWTTADGITTDDIRYGTYDDWMMNAADGSLPSSTKAPEGKRNEYAGYYGLGDDWGLPHGEFLAAKNALDPVKTQVQSLDLYLEKAVWEHLMGNTADTTKPSYLVYDFWEQGKPGAANTTPSYRGYAYPHIYNTFFSMYQIAKQNPGLISYSHPSKWYLTQAYGVFKELYDGPVAYNWNTGLMGELTTPALIDALRTEGMTEQANDIEAKMAVKYKNFSSEKYPYGSEYSYDNTGEEAVYTLAKLNVNADKANALRMMRDIVAKTRAARGQMPVWYWYADPTTITGENWWQFQYSIALAGYTMDDYINHTSALETGTDAVTPTERAELQRLNYASKLGAIANVNSGQISNVPANIGASAWSYQSEKGNLGTLGVGGGTNVQLLNGWRGMTGESDLNLWGALQNMSADVVTDDPIFGTIGYGATVSSDQSSTTVQPTDGVQRKLNLVSQQLSVDLNSDRYTQAVVGKNSADLRLDLANVSGAAHTGSFDVTGLAQGTYSVLVNGHAQRKINVYTPAAAAGTLRAPTSVTYQVPAGSSYTVRLVTAAPDANTAPKVNAGADQTGIVNGLDDVTLSGSATDDGLGNPNGTLNSTWTVNTKPSGATATISDPKSLHPTVKVSGAGNYLFTLTGSDGSLQSTDSVKVTVTAPAPMPTNWVNYTFATASGKTVPDTSGSGNNATLNGTAAVTSDAGTSALRLDGADGSYLQLPNDIVSRGTSMTISTRLKVDSVQTFGRIFDFGSNTTKYMFLTPALGDGHVGFAISNAGNGAETQITSDYTMKANTWTTLKLTFKPNSDGTTTGTLYADGTQIGQNTAMKVAPKDLGRTTGDYLGKSQFPDPYLKGTIDTFEIHGDVR